MQGIWFSLLYNIFLKKLNILISPANFSLPIKLPDEKYNERSYAFEKEESIRN